MKKTPAKNSIVGDEHYPNVSRELAFMDAVAKLVASHYPEGDGEGECGRVFTWALNRFAPEGASLADVAKDVLHKFLASPVGNPMFMPGSTFPGSPPPGSPTKHGPGQ